MARRALRRAARELTNNVRAVISVAPQRPMLGHLGERTRVFWALDDYTAGADLIGVSRTTIVRGEKRLRRDADVVLTVSPNLAERERRAGVRPSLLPNGCDVEHFADARRRPRPSDIRVPSPIAGYVGGLSERLEVELLEAVADTGVSLLLVGPRSQRFDLDRLQSLLRRNNVQWVGQKDFSDLPAYFGHMDVGLVPYTNTAFNRASFPLKTLEYLAAGCRVVSSDLPTVRGLNTDLVDIRDDVEGFTQGVQAALSSPLTPREVAGRQAFAAQHSWDARARTLLALLKP